MQIIPPLTFSDIWFQVTAHLLDDTTVEGRLLYHQEHYDLAFLKIAMDRSVQVASFADTFNSGQQALQLGRDGNLILRITLGKVTQGDFVYFCRDKKYEVQKYFILTAMRDFALVFSFTIYCEANAPTTPYYSKKHMCRRQRHGGERVRGKDRDILYMHHFPLSYM